MWVRRIGVSGPGVWVRERGLKKEGAGYRTRCRIPLFFLDSVEDDLHPSYFQDKKTGLSDGPKTE